MSGRGGGYGGRGGRGRPTNLVAFDANEPPGNGGGGRGGGGRFGGRGKYKKPLNANSNFMPKANGHGGQDPESNEKVSIAALPCRPSLLALSGRH